MDYMRRAIELAESAAGGVSPRPPVGAVIVNGGEVVGEGCTTPGPGPHAEQVALERAGERARGATAYCTLEPHSFAGTTPPCTEALIQAGVERVVCPVIDPHPDVNGAGFRRLEEAGVAVVRDAPADLVRDAEGLIEGFAHRLRTGRPLITAKFAMSLDGKIATRTGESQWITGEASREAAHRMRARADAVMVGIGTLLADDPRLTARPGGKPLPEPRPRLRVVVDSAGRAPPSARVFWASGKVLLVHAVRSEDAGPLIGLPDNVEKLALPPGYGGVDLVMLVDELADRGLNSVMVEGGGGLLGSMIDLGLVDKVAAFIAPVVIGGAEAPSPIGGSGAERLAEALRLQGVRIQQFDGDVLVSGYVPEGAGRRAGIGRSALVRTPTNEWP